MTEENNFENLDRPSQTRRTFFKTSAQVAVTAPAVSVLLSATAKRAMAQISPYQASSSHILDDFTFGNNREDIDAFRYGNFNPRNGQLNLDDHIS